MRLGSLPRQICVIVAVANTIITGRRGRKREVEGDSREEKTEGMRLVSLHVQQAGIEFSHLATSQQTGSQVNSVPAKLNKLSFF